MDTEHGNSITHTGELILSWNSFQVFIHCRCGASGLRLPTSNCAA
jgi:hypothetical protein